MVLCRTLGTLSQGKGGIILNSDFQSMISGPPVPVSPGKQCEIKILRPQPKLTESEPLAEGPGNLFYQAVPGTSTVCLSLRG